jgi:hypothetical protein
MRPLVAFVTLGLVVPACGGDGGGGEPITGTLAIDWGADHVMPDVGTTFENPDAPSEMWVLLGTAGLDCGTDLESPIAQGHYVMFSVDRTTPGTATPTVAVFRKIPESLQIRSSSGMVTIDVIGEDRITGSVLVETMDDESGRIAAAGTFDVARCF